ncbi:MAG: low molecular weight phosphotyrosine protein phosphatase [Cytophagales bacterium]|nr:low molecular weight phosphotyrosine protein phosphatase [Cytophagales bacterium]
MKTKVLFVCLGNICRSPMGEGAFLNLINEKGITDEFEVDSAGTAAYHVGNLPDKRMRETAYSHGVLLTSRARQFQKEDFHTFDYILAMDESNLKNINRLKPTNPKAKVFLMREFDELVEQDKNVPDPYYGGIEGFEEVYQMLTRSSKTLLDFIQNEK